MIEENTPVEGETQEVVELSPVEQRAMEMGWRPKEEFSGDEADFIDAKEFVSRKPLFDKIEGQSKQLKNVTKALEALKVHYTKVQETEYNRALASLKAERKQALTNSDGDEFERIDDEIKRVEAAKQVVEEAQKTPVVQEEPPAAPEFQAWTNKNRWYQNDEPMTAYADKLGTRLASLGHSPGDVLVQVEKAVRKEFPHKFRNPNKDAAPDVANGGQPVAKNTGKEPELSEQERNVMNALVRSGTMTKEQYLKDLKAIKSKV